MHVILTHEQADFDALASLLGASLINETAVPVLPRRMNRNVRAFITLYGVDLPFVDPRDLPPGPIDKITLVDTQSLVSLKGMTSETKVQVIDHHPVRYDLPPNWHITTDETGATVTLFVEVIRERGGVLSPVQSTLLLLGIYEDTGSLTYSRTTARDIRAVAFLVENGANLGIASNFLNHPLSITQQALYDHFRSEAETITIHGHVIVLACGNAQDMDEELSTIAHKLRDHLDPDALFLLIRTRGGIQMIARSTSDNIDVSEVAGHFTGGGHSRAAAALIKDREMNDVVSELREVLPGYIKPALTVAQIMSPGPQVLSPGTPVEEAAQRMRRYGYEGYPVVNKGKVIGLLTRRAVDRAISHNLNLTAASLMEAGEVTIHPGDSLETLQRRMTETGWGQIPVVNAQTKDIIGIVTRTDLLKTLNQEARQPSRKNLADRLEAALPPARLALLQSVAAVAHQHRAAVYIVGGFVRDLLLERPSLDFDLVVEGDAITLARAVSEKYGGRVTSHARFGTAKWFISNAHKKVAQALENEIQMEDKEETDPASYWRLKLLDKPLDAKDLPQTLDFISARTEFYTYPTALPTVERSSIKLDLHRRDFTINTLALRLDGRHYGDLHDHWGGLSDLRHGLVRCLHSLSFVDDPTRMLRAVRFEQRFGFSIETRTLDLLHEAQTLIERVSGDRIRHEFDHILEEERVTAMLARLDELGLLNTIHPDFTWDDWIGERITRLKQQNLDLDWKEWDLSASQKKDLPEPGPALRRNMIYLLWLMRLPEQKARSVLARLKIPRSLSDRVLEASRLWREFPGLADARPSQIVAYLEELSSVAVFGVYIAMDDPHQRELLHTYATQWRNILPRTTGKDLLQRGLPQGPRYKEILWKLRAAWLDGQVTNADEEQLLLEKLISGEGEQDRA
jgi:tRNA nucleotidyltransferase (CCA-adding enzyme)